jgi:acyl-CoA synthetase (AMP-forming)/AMP-acid ligase II
MEEEAMDPLDLGTVYQSLERTVAKYGDRPAYAVPPMKGRAYHPDGWECTWTEAFAAVQQRKRHYAEAGYGPGHRVAILFDQRPEFVFHYFALNALGVSVVPMSPDHRRDEMVYQLDHSEACLALAIKERIEDVRAAVRELPKPIPVMLFDDLSAPLPEPATAARDIPLDGHTEAGLLYTSGTTGRPKGCVLSNEYFHTFGGRFVSRGGCLAMREGEERLYNPLPLHHANAWSISLHAMLLLGGCFVFPDRFHASSFWRDIVTCKVTALQFQGVIPAILLKLAETPEERAHKVKFALCAGIEPSLHEVFEKRYGFPLVEMWAMTETGRITADHIEPRMIHTRAIGRSWPGEELRVVDAAGNDVPVGQPGEFVIRNSAEAPRKGFFSGYLKNPEATEEAWRGGWFHTGDMMTRDESGMFFFMDRSKNIIRRAGENIAAAEIEECLTAHEKVKQVAVLAVPDEIREEEVMSVVIPKSPENAGEDLARELFDWCCERLAYFKAPAYVLFVESLPTTSSQKIQKVKLFPQGIDPRARPGVIDLRALKQKSTKKPRK